MKKYCIGNQGSQPNVVLQNKEVVEEDEEEEEEDEEEKEGDKENGLAGATETLISI